MKRRDFMKGAAAAGLLPGIASAQQGVFTSLHVMDTWFWGAKMKFEEEAALLKKLEYLGMAGSWGQKLKERLAALKAAGLVMPGVWIPVGIDEPAYPENLSKLVEQTRGSGAFVWLSLTSKKDKKSEPTGDEAALTLINRLADDCEKAGAPGVALYPHVGFWLEKVSDALRLAGKAKRQLIGVQFNLYHWMATEAGQDIKKVLEEAKPHLKSVSINGSSTKKASILPLGEGDFDPLPMILALRDIGFAGPIAHQGYGIKGDIPAKLGAAKEAWGVLRRRMIEGR